MATMAEPNNKQPTQYASLAWSVLGAILTAAATSIAYVAGTGVVIGGFALGSVPYLGIVAMVTAVCTGIFTLGTLFKFATGWSPLGPLFRPSNTATAIESPPSQGNPDARPSVVESPNVAPPPPKKEQPGSKPHKQALSAPVDRAKKVKQAAAKAFQNKLIKLSTALQQIDEIEDALEGDENSNVAQKLARFRQQVASVQLCLDRLENDSVCTKLQNDDPVKMQVNQVASALDTMQRESEKLHKTDIELLRKTLTDFRYSEIHFGPNRGFLGGIKETKLPHIVNTWYDYNRAGAFSRTYTRLVGLSGYKPCEGSGELYPKNAQSVSLHTFMEAVALLVQTQVRLYHTTFGTDKANKAVKLADNTEHFAGYSTVRHRKAQFTEALPVLKRCLQTLMVFPAPEDKALKQHWEKLLNVVEQSEILFGHKWKVDTQNSKLMTTAMLRQSLPQIDQLKKLGKDLQNATAPAPTHAAETESKTCGKGIPKTTAGGAAIIPVSAQPAADNPTHDVNQKRVAPPNK